MTVPTSRSRSLAVSSPTFGDYLQLTKPRLSTLVLFTTLAGYRLGAATEIVIWHLTAALIGTLLVVGGANAINQVLEMDADALMHRTRRRPLPAGRLVPRRAAAFGISIAVVGGSILVFAVNWLSSLLAVLALVIYVFVYTPMKRKTPLCTLVGAIPGAIPPAVGWVAARGTIDNETVVLFAILYLWQLPHFLAIARLYRDDYARGGMPMLPVVDPDSGTSEALMLASCIGLVPLSLMPSFLGLTGEAYLIGASMLGLAFLAVAAVNVWHPSRSADRRTFYTSLVYLTLLFLLMISDRLAGVD